MRGLAARRQWSAWTLPLALIAGVTLWRLAIAALVPVTKDEAYYFDWARHLAWGYFDHPPGVALLGLGTWLEPASALAARLGAIVAGALTLLLLWRFYRRCGLRRLDCLLLAVLLVAATPAGLVSGIITTPDTALALCWAFALHEAAAALDGDRRRWLSAGIATGLGLLGKYTMLVIGPVFLWALLRADPKALRTRWPYLGGLLALLVFLPNILWNAQHDWITMRFQLGHGFSTETGPIILPGEALPAPTDGQPGAGQMQQEPPRGLAERLASLGGYLGSQLAFWGLLVIPMAAALVSHGGLRRIRADLADRLTPVGRALLGAGTLVPLILFAAVAWISEVEANWSAMYLAAAAPLVAVAVRPLVPWAMAAAGLNLLLVSLYSVHAATGALPLPNAAERIIRETQGYEALAAHAKTLPAPVFADRYQITGMLNFYQPGLGAGQWPGITRPSEYLLGRITPIPAVASLRESGFTLITRRYQAPAIPGFVVAEAQTVIHCVGKPISVLAGTPGQDAPPCADPARQWRIYHYLGSDDSAGAAIVDSPR